VFALSLSASLARIVYVGTNQDIRVYNQLGNGSLTLLQSVPGPAPSAYLAIHPSGKYLYSAGNAAYASFTIGSDGRLSPKNSVSSNGEDPCHVSVHPRGNILFGANYGSGSFVSFLLGQDGSISPLADSQTPGKAILVNADRQDGPHAHMIAVTPNETLVVGVDLGSDKFFTFQVDLSSGKFKPGPVPYGQVSSGSGNRHFVFHPSGKFAYVVCELTSTVEVFSFDWTRGAFTSVQVISALAEGFSGTADAAEIRIHPSGLYLYSTNRGPDSIAVFTVNSATGRLSLVQTISSHGATPRGLNIDPTGKFLYVGNQNGNNVVFYTVAANGQLTYVQDYPATGAMDVEFGISA